MCHLVFIYLQREPLSLRGAGVLIYLLICPGAGGRETGRRRCADAQMETWRGLKEVEGHGYFYLCESHPLDVGG